MSKFIPLISSGIAGPLGVLHLPRLWQKSSLAARGKLHDDYPGCGKGYDQMVLDGLGIDKAEFESYIASSRPSYPQLEAWILSKKGGKIDSTAVSTLNSAIAGYNHTDEVRGSILGACNVPDTGNIKDAINLNNLDDWQAFHKEELA